MLISFHVLLHQALLTFCSNDIQRAGDGIITEESALRTLQDFDSIEIGEAHHAGKIDSPSGTAVRTAEMIADARQGMTQPLIPGVGQEARGHVVAGVPIHSLRLAGVSAKQDIIFGGESEVLTIAHEVSSIRSYVNGILMSIRTAAKSTGLVVGLQAVVDANTKN